MSCRQALVTAPLLCAFLGVYDLAAQAATSSPAASNSAFGGPLADEMQQSLALYRAKFVCGHRPPASTPLGLWDAVAPGSYYTAINLYNSNADSAIVRSNIVTTRSAPASGDVIAGPTVVIPTRRAVEIDCAEILGAANVPFLKGFLAIASSRRLLVVAVYSVADSNRVVSMDVESVP